jgi:hypothetical protein
MRADTLLMCVALLSAGCASVSLAPSRSAELRYMPRGASGPALTQPPHEECPHKQVEAAALAMPELMGQLTREFNAISNGARTAMEKAGKTLAVAQWVEMLTMVSALNLREVGEGTPRSDSRRWELEAGAHVARPMEPEDHGGAATS